MENKESPRCFKPWQELVISADGMFQPCCYRGYYGNSQNTKPLRNVNLETIEEI